MASVLCFGGGCHCYGQFLLELPVVFRLQKTNRLDPTKKLSDCKFHLYADDTVLYCAGDIVQLGEKLQLSFNALQAALISLKLVLNEHKTKFMLFFRDTDDNNIHISTRSNI